MLFCHFLYSWIIIPYQDNLMVTHWIDKFRTWLPIHDQLTDNFFSSSLFSCSFVIASFKLFVNSLCLIRILAILEYVQTISAKHFHLIFFFFFRKLRIKALSWECWVVLLWRSLVQFYRDFLVNEEMCLNYVRNQYIHKENQCTNEINIC